MKALQVAMLAVLSVSCTVSVCYADDVSGIASSNASVAANDTAASPTTPTTTTLETSQTTDMSPAEEEAMLEEEEKEMEEENRCYTDAYLQNFCDIPGEMDDVTIWDLYSVLFSDDILQELWDECTKGAWCLYDKYDYWDSVITERADIVMKAQVTEDMCHPHLKPCIESIADNYIGCPVYERMAFAAEAINIVCELKSYQSLSLQCYEHVLATLHVSLSDRIRETEGTEIPTETESPIDTCDVPETAMTRNYICVINSCQVNPSVFKTFKFWRWFTGSVDTIARQCNLNLTQCEVLVPSGMSGYTNKMVGGIVAAVMVVAVTLMITVYVCYKRKRREVVLKDGYQQLFNAGDQS